MPERLPPYASLRLGMIDLEARPCPPGPTAPATQTARDVVPGSAKKCYACTSRGQEGSPPYVLCTGQPQRPTVRTLGSPIGQPGCPHFICLKFTDRGRYDRLMLSPGYRRKRGALDGVSWV